MWLIFCVSPENVRLSPYAPGPTDSVVAVLVGAKHGRCDVDPKAESASEESWASALAALAEMVEWAATPPA
jgi:hypothetical protein